MTPTFVDTSAHYAIADAEDYDHDAAVEFLHSAADEGRAFLTSNFIIAETYGLILLFGEQDRGEVGGEVLWISDLRHV